MPTQTGGDQRFYFHGIDIVCNQSFYNNTVKGKHFIEIHGWIIGNTITGASNIYAPYSVTYLSTSTRIENCELSSLFFSQTDNTCRFILLDSKVNLSSSYALYTNLVVYKSEAIITAPAYGGSVTNMQKIEIVLSKVKTSIPRSSSFILIVESCTFTGSIIADHCTMWIRFSTIIESGFKKLTLSAIPSTDPIHEIKNSVIEYSDIFLNSFTSAEINHSYIMHSILGNYNDNKRLSTGVNKVTDSTVINVIMWMNNQGGNQPSSYSPMYISIIKSEIKNISYVPMVQPGTAVSATISRTFDQCKMVNSTFGYNAYGYSAPLSKNFSCVDNTIIYHKTELTWEGTNYAGWFVILYPLPKAEKFTSYSDWVTYMKTQKTFIPILHGTWCDGNSTDEKLVYDLRIISNELYLSYQDRIGYIAVNKISQLSGTFTDSLWCPGMKENVV